MSDKMKVKVAFASALVRQLWIAGLITKAEQNTMAERSKQELLKSNNLFFSFSGFGLDIPAFFWYLCPCLRGRGKKLWVVQIHHPEGSK